jgi:hypothetical protein
MGRLMRAVITFFMRKGWRFYLTDSSRHLVVLLPEMQVCAKFIVEVREDQGMVLVYTMARLVIPGEKRQSVDSYIGRVNEHCSIGSFDVNMKDGLLAYRTGIQIGVCSLTDDLIAPLFAHGLVATAIYIPVVEDIVNDRVTVAQAVALLDDVTYEDVLQDTAIVLDGATLDADVGRVHDARVEDSHDDEPFDPGEITDPGFSAGSHDPDD